jgi:hypothetical protein
MSASELLKDFTDPGAVCRRVQTRSAYCSALLHIPTAREWILQRMRRPNVRREVATQATG